MSTTGTSTGTSTAEAAKGAATDVAGHATSAASDVAGQAASAASDVKQTVTSELGSVVGEATDRAGAVLRTSQQELRSQIQSKAQGLSSTLGSTADQLASMADAADDPSSPVAQLSRTAAQQLRQHSQRLEEGGIEGMLEDAKRFARNRPGAFFLGTVAAGFAFGRLAKHADLKQAVDTAKQELTGGGDQESQVQSTGTGNGMLPSATVPPNPSPSVGAPPVVGGTSAQL